jgi:diphthamide biosynthesis protein 2
MPRLGYHVGVRRITHSLVQEFLRPIITPFEFEVALQAEGTWSGQYVLDFEKLLAGESENNIGTIHYSRRFIIHVVPSGAVAEDEGDDPDQPTFSLVTGKYRQPKLYGSKHDFPLLDLGLYFQAQGDETPTEGTSAALTLRNQDDTVSKLVDSAAGECFAVLSFS